MTTPSGRVARLVVTLGVVAFAATALAQPPSSKTWRLVGPPGGWDVPVVDPTAPSVMFRRSVSGTLIGRTTDGGATWSRQVLSVPYMQALQIDAGGSGILYGNTGFTAYRSTDAGQTWTVVKADTSLDGFWVDPRTPGRAFASTCPLGSSVCLLERTDDSGSTWRELWRGAYSVAAMAFPRSAPQTFYVSIATVSANALLRSQDGGATIQTLSVPVNDPYGTEIAADAVDPALVYLLDSSGLVYRSQNGGAQWTLALIGGTRLEFVEDRTTGDSLFVTTSRYSATHPAVWRHTSTRGASWSSEVALPNDLESFTVDPLTAGRLWGRPRFDVTPPGVYRSANGGGTWTVTPDAQPGADVRGIAVDPVDPQTLLVATRQALFRTADGGTTWTRVLNDGGPWVFQPQPQPSVAFAPSDRSRAYALTDNQHLVRSTNGGQTWSAPGVDVVDWLVVDRVTPTTLYGLVGAGVSQSVDGGATWQPVAPAIPTSAPFGSPRRAMAVSGGATRQIYGTTSYWYDGPGLPPYGWADVYRWEPAGTWTRILGCAAISHGCISYDLFGAPADPFVLYAYDTSSRTLLVTHDRGDSWQMAGPLFDASSVQSGLQAEIIAFEVSPSNADVAVAFTPGAVFRTIDGGRTWVRHAAYDGLAGASVQTNTYNGGLGGRSSGWSAAAWQPAGITLFVGTSGGAYANFQADSDGDGMLDDWETTAGLNPLSSTGDDGPSGDPDRDGLTNAQELASATQPLTAELFFAEGATGGLGFGTRFAILNPQPDVTADVTFEFLLRTGQHVTHALPPLAPGERATVDTGAIATLPQLANAEFSTVVRSPYRVIVDRTMTWDASGYGSHAETGVARPSATWYLAEGATHSQFDLFYLVQNPAPTATVVQITFLRPAPATPLTKTYTVPAASRFNVWVNYEDFPGLGKALAATDVSAIVQSLDGTPIVVERAMYRAVPGELYGAGHESAGVTAPAVSWFIAEGATGPFFDEFILIANPGDVSAEIDATYLLPGGRTLQKHYSVGARSRFNIWVDLQDPALANTAVSAILRSTNGQPIVVERAMWWPDGAWSEAHDSVGTTTTGTAWALAEGEVRTDAVGTDTFVLVANTSAYAGEARVTLYYENGGNESRTYRLDPVSRTSAWIRVDFPQSANRRFGIVVESLAAAGGGAPAEIVVERSMYSDAGGVRWAAGTNALATKLR